MFVLRLRSRLKWPRESVYATGRGLPLQTRRMVVLAGAGVPSSSNTLPERKIGRCNSGYCVVCRVESAGCWLTDGAGTLVLPPVEDPPEDGAGVGAGCWVCPVATATPRASPSARPVVARDARGIHLPCPHYGTAPRQTTRFSTGLECAGHGCAQIDCCAPASSARMRLNQVNGHETNFRCHRVPPAPPTHGWLFGRTQSRCYAEGTRKAGRARHRAVRPRPDVRYRPQLGAGRTTALDGQPGSQASQERGRKGRRMGVHLRHPTKAPRPPVHLLRGGGSRLQPPRVCSAVPRTVGSREARPDPSSSRRSRRTLWQRTKSP